MELLDDLDHALQATGRLVAAVPDASWSAGTPCPGWSVADVVDHLNAGHRLFAAALTGDSPAPPDESAGPGTDYPVAAAALLAAARAPGALGRTVTVPFGTVPAPVAVNLRVVEALIHGWDIAEGTGLALDTDDAVVGRALGFTGGALRMVPPERSPFGVPQEAPDDAPPLVRLAALLGRRVDR